MNQENLIGTLAMVHPKLHLDPARKEGEVGVIIYVSKAEHNIYMRFPNGGEGVYQGDEVLRLKDKNKVLDTLVNEGDSMGIEDFKDLYKVSLLQDRATSTDILSALEIARDNPRIWDKTLEIASPVQSIRHEKTWSR
jgi:hypothetical protein